MAKKPASPKISGPAKKVAAVPTNAAPAKAVTSKASTAKKPVAAAASEVVEKTPVRKTIVPKAAVSGSPAKKSVKITHAMIAERAFYLSRNSYDSQDENWHRAERELRSELE